MNTKRLLGTAAICLASVAAGQVCAQISDDVIKIGFITDLSSVYSAPDGPAGAEAIRIAIAEMGGSINGKKIELVVADHQNKADIASSKSREWFDREGVDMLIAGTNSATNLAMAKVAWEKKKPFFAVGGGTARLTNEECSPYTIQYAYDTASVARTAGAAVVKRGGKSWFFISADYAYGASLEKEMSDVVKANGGSVVGRIAHPISVSDFSSFLLQAQASKAQIVGLGNAGNDLINAIKGANEFGLTKTQKLAAPLMFDTDVHGLGLALTQGMYTASAWYWDMNDKSRAWSKEFFSRVKKAPTFLQAADYSAALFYLKAVKAVGSDDGDKVMAKMRASKVNDMFASNGVIRPDGRMIHDMYLLQVKAPADSKYPWDYFSVVQTIPGDQVSMSKAESTCALWK